MLVLAAASGLISKSFVSNQNAAIFALSKFMSVKDTFVDSIMANNTVVTMEIDRRRMEIRHYHCASPFNEKLGCF